MMITLKDLNVVRVVSSEEAAQALEKKGYTRVTSQAQGKAVSDMTVAELKAHAKKTGIDLGSVTARPDILAVIEAAEKGGGGNGDAGNT